MNNLANERFDDILNRVLIYQDHILNPTMKECSCCKEVKPQTTEYYQFCRNKGCRYHMGMGNGVWRKYCRICENANRTRTPYKDKSPEQQARMNAAVIKYFQTPKGKIATARASKNNVERLSDSYIKSQYYYMDLTKDEITSELIELKRNNIKLKRDVRKKTENRKRA